MKALSAFVYSLLENKVFLIIIDVRYKHKESNMVLRPSGQVIVKMGMMS